MKVTGRLRRFLLRGLLGFYPSAFRAEFGAEVLSTGEEALEAAALVGRFELLRTWLHLLRDAVVQGTLERASRFSPAKSSEAAQSGPERTATQTLDLSVETFLTECRHAARGLLKRPGFALVSAFTLALGIGATTTIFSVFNAVVLRPLPFAEPDRLVALWHSAPGVRPDEINQSPASYFLYRENNRAFEDLGLWDTDRVTILGAEEPELVSSLKVTEGLLPTVGFPLELGRPFSAQDDAPNAAGTAILNHFYWQSRFGSDPDVIGRTLSVDGEPHEIIGVLSAGFPFARQAILTPARFDRSTVRNGDFSYQIIGRLKPDATLASAQADLARLLPRLGTEFSGNLTPAVIEEGQFRPVVRSLREDFLGDAGGPLWALLGTVGMVLLVACANVGNLLLVRAEGRQHEVAVRKAMGASRASIARLFLIESAALGLLGGLFGLVLATVGTTAIHAFGPEVLRQIPDVGIDRTVLAFTIGTSLLSGLLFGLVPLSRYGRPDVVGSLKEAGRGASAGREQHRIRDGLVVAQLATAVVLLVSSGLMMRSFQALQTVDPGFDRPAELLTVTLSLPEVVVPEAADVAIQHEQILERLAQIPGVSSVGASTSIAMDGRDSHRVIFFDDFPPENDGLGTTHRTKSVAGEYAATMGIPLLAGRHLNWSDLHARARSVVVSEDLALKYWNTPNEALGRRLGYRQGDWWEIVGVTGAVRDDGLHKEHVPIIYFPMVETNTAGETSVRRSLTHVVRTTAGKDLIPQIREAVWSVNPSLPLTGLGSHADVVEESLSRTTFAMTILGISAAMALLLGTVGIYSVISYVVSRRTREIGVRMALGANRSAVTRLVMRQGVVLTSAGLGVGLIGALAVARVLSAALFGVATLDLLTLGSVAIGLAAISLSATYVPALRATRVDPSTALRQE